MNTLLRALLTGISMTFVAVPAFGGLLGHWKLDDASGTTAIDSSTSGFDADQTIVAGSWTTGKSGGAYDAPRFSLDAVESDTLNLEGGSVTISVWVTDRTGSNFEGIAGFEGTGSTGDIYGFKMDNADRINWTTIGTSPQISGDTLENYAAATSDGWVHLVGVYDGTTETSTVYVNGISLGAVTKAGGIPDKTTPSTFNIGRYYNSTGFAFTGSIDDVQVYDTALSAADVSFLNSNPGNSIGSRVTVAMGAPTATAISDDGASLASRLFSADADEVTVVWAYADQDETDVATWTAAPGGGSHSFGAASQNEVLSRVITGLDGDTQYRFRFFATAGADSAWSGLGTFATGLGSSSAPADLAGTPAVGTAVTRVDLTWTDSYTNETGFVIQRSTDSGFGSFDEFLTGADETSFTDNTTDANTTYYYRVAAVGSSGNGAFSAGVEVTTGDNPPQGLLALWRMDGGTIDGPGAAMLADSSGNGYDLPTDSRFGQGTYSPGAADTGILRPRYQAAESSSRALAFEGGSTVSLSAWVYLQDDDGANDLTGSQGIGGYPGTGSGVDQYGLTTANGGIIWNYNGASGFVNVRADFTPSSVGGWYHVVGVYESGLGGTLYVSGPGLTDTMTATGDDVGDLADNKVDAGARFAIGTYANSGGFTSSKVIDEVQVYNLALTAEEVAFLYNNPGSVVGSAEVSLDLVIIPNGENFDFTWNSRSGKVYDLVSSTDLSTPIENWPVHDDGAFVYENLVPSGTGSSSLTGVIGSGTKRFFAIIEKN